MSSIMLSDSIVVFSTGFTQRGWIYKRVGSNFKSTFYPCTVFHQPGPLAEDALILVKVLTGRQDTLTLQVQVPMEYFCFGASVSNKIGPR